MATNQSVKLLVKFSAMTYGGDALGRLPDGRAVFAPFVLAGETAEIQIIEEKKNHAKARMIKILEPSPFRIEARCGHFGVCGGCHYQNLPYEEQLKLKQAIVKEQFQRVGGMPDGPVEAVISSAQEWNYRNSLQFHLDSAGKLGFHRSGSHSVLPIRECHLPEEGINGLWPRLEFDPLMKIDRITLRCGKDESQMVVLESESGELPEFETDMPISVVHRTGSDQVVLAGEEFLEMIVKERRFRVSAGSFFQVNSGQAAAMVEFIQQALPLTKQDLLLDVYCGVGLFSSFLAESAGQVAGVEIGESACEDYAFNLDAFDNISLYQGPAEAVLPALELKPTAIIVDPPRAGVELPVMDAILKTGAERLVYVSCDPATLARDSRRLTVGGYELKVIQPVDMFPQTYHIECMAVFEMN
jgi:23S rRNA (uracil1939-C5)-methyltransferase